MINEFKICEKKCKLGVHEMSENALYFGVATAGRFRVSSFETPASWVSNPAFRPRRHGPVFATLSVPVRGEYDFALLPRQCLRQKGRGESWGATQPRKRGHYR